MTGHPADDGPRTRRRREAAHRLTVAGYPTPVRCACAEHTITTTETRNSK